MYYGGCDFYPNSCVTDVNPLFYLNNRFNINHYINDNNVINKQI